MDPQTLFLKFQPILNKPFQSHIRTSETSFVGDVIKKIFNNLDLGSRHKISLVNKNYQNFFNDPLNTQVNHQLCLNLYRIALSHLRSFKMDDEDLYSCFLLLSKIDLVRTLQFLKMEIKKSLAQREMGKWIYISSVLGSVSETSYAVKSLVTKVHKIFEENTKWFTLHASSNLAVAIANSGDNVRALNILTTTHQSLANTQFNKEPLVWSFAKIYLNQIHENPTNIQQIINKIHCSNGVLSIDILNRMALSCKIFDRRLAEELLNLIKAITGVSKEIIQGFIYSDNLDMAWKLIELWKENGKEPLFSWYLEILKKCRSKSELYEIVLKEISSIDPKPYFGELAKTYIKINLIEPAQKLLEQMKSSYKKCRTMIRLAKADRQRSEEKQVYLELALNNELPLIFIPQLAHKRILAIAKCYYPINSERAQKIVQRIKLDKEDYQVRKKLAYWHIFTASNEVLKIYDAHRPDLCGKDILSLLELAHYPNGNYLDVWPLLRTTNNSF